MSTKTAQIEPQTLPSDGYPKFTLNEPRYNQSEYMGRVKHFFGMVDPFLLLTPEAKVNESIQLMESAKNKTLPSNTYTDAQLWEARRIKESMVHPDTNEIIPSVFRVSAFVPSNVPIIAGMLMTSPTILNTAMWQWINQSYNAGFNYANRNASSPQTTTQIATAYASASLISVGTAVGLGEAVKRATALSPGARAIITTVVPYVAVASAGVANMLLMRKGEAVDGIDLYDADKNLVGRSPAAGKIALSQVAMTRIVLPIPILILPPVVMHFVKRLPIMRASAPLRTVTEIAVISGSLWGALPLAVSLFPQIMSVDTSKLEPRFHEMRKPNGEAIKTLYYNKGV